MSLKNCRHFASSTLLSLAVGALAASCSRAETPDPSPKHLKDNRFSGDQRPGEATEADAARRLCSALHELPARRKAQCCGAGSERPLFDECVRVVGASLQAGAVRVDRDALARCERGMQAALVGCDWVTPGQALAVDACHGVLRPELTVGKRCRSSLECRAPLHCEGATPNSAGVCAPPAALGAACGAQVDALASYVQDRRLADEHPLCAEQCSLLRHRCEPVPALGAPCWTSANCAPGQTCSAGRCSARAPAKLGQSCADLPCAAALRCRAGICVAPASAGAACATDFDCAAGGCVTTADGRQQCGMKCSVSLQALRASAAPTLRLPLRARAAE